MTLLVVLTVVVIVVLIAGLAFYLYWAGTLLNQIAGNLEESLATAGEIVGHAKLIAPGVEHINRPAAWWQGHCRCFTGWPRTSWPTSPRDRRRPQYPNPRGRRRVDAVPASSRRSASPRKARA